MTDAQQDEARRRRAEGAMFAELAGSYGVGKSTISRRVMESEPMFPWADFELGFWHPFGPYTGRSVASILEWKRDEAEQYGWTLWSFAACDLKPWMGLLGGTTASVYVLCSESPPARDPDVHRGERYAEAYQFDDGIWQMMPDRTLMNVTNPFRRRGEACAFKIRRVITLAAAEVPPITIQWFRKKTRSWCNDRLPSRGEFLIRRGGEQLPRRVRAVLELSPPYLARLRAS